MIVLAALLVFIVVRYPARALPGVARLAVVGVLAALITCYYWLPFVLLKAYLSEIVYVLPRKPVLPSEAKRVVTWLLGGQLLDYGRIPVLTAMAALGAAYGVVERNRPARVALVLFALSLILFLDRGRSRLASVLPMHEMLVSRRFIGLLDLAAILLVGLGGEWLWRQFKACPGRAEGACPEVAEGSLREPWRAVVPGLIVLAVMVSALSERYHSYRLDARAMDETAQALAADPDWPKVLASLKGLPPGRTYAATKPEWRNRIRFGALWLEEILIFNDVDLLWRGQRLSLNSELLQSFDLNNPAHYELFNVRYVVAPTGQPMPEFLNPIGQTPRYTLYRADTTGYGQFASYLVGADDPRVVDSEKTLYEQNRKWLQSSYPAEGKFIRWGYPPGKQAHSGAPAPPGPGGGTVLEERISPSRIELQVDCPRPSNLVIKVTYHPNWRLTIDGRPAAFFMVSPSFIGLTVPAGRHYVRAEYHSGWLKKILLALSALTLAGVILFRRRLESVEKILQAWG